MTHFFIKIEIYPSALSRLHFHCSKLHRFPFNPLIFVKQPLHIWCEATHNNLALEQVSRTPGLINEEIIFVFIAPHCTCTLPNSLPMFSWTGDWVLMRIINFFMTVDYMIILNSIMTCFITVSDRQFDRTTMVSLSMNQIYKIWIYAICHTPSKIGFWLFVIRNHYCSLWR